MPSMNHKQLNIVFCLYLMLCIFIYSGCDKSKSSTTQCNSLVCSNYARCDIVNEQAQCVCEDDYQFDGNECISLCALTTCPIKSTCMMQEGEATCQCEAEYMMNQNECVWTQDLSIYFRKPIDWKDPVYLYYWDVQPSSTIHTEVVWPGIEMQVVDSTWYGVEIPHAMSAHLIFTDGEQQSMNLQRSYNGWYKDGVWYDEKPQDEAQSLCLDEQGVSQCSDWQSCDQGSCVTAMGYCAQDTECQNEEICTVNHRCEVENMEMNCSMIDCEMGWECVEGRCIAPAQCQSDADCDQGSCGDDQRCWSNQSEWIIPCTSTLDMHVSLLDQESVRVHYVRNLVPHPERGWIINLDAFTGLDRVNYWRTDQAYHLRSDHFELEVNIDCHFTLKQDDQVIWESLQRPTIELTGAVKIERRLYPQEHIYGLGEKTAAADRRGRIHEMYTTDPAWQSSGEQTGYNPLVDLRYQAHPYFLSVHQGRSHATFLHNTFHTYFDVGATDSQSLSISADGGDLDLFFILGDSPQKVSQNYSKITGSMPLPPMWTLGYHQCRWSYKNENKIREVAQGFRDRTLPADGIWFDIDYMDGWRDFTWNTQTTADQGFPNPSGLITDLQNMGFKSTALIDPGVKASPTLSDGSPYEPYISGMEGDHFIKDPQGDVVIKVVWPGDAVFPDYTKESTRAWWGEWIGRFMQDSGLQGIWIDMNEPAVFVDGVFPPYAVVDGDGISTQFFEVRNLYGHLMARATYEGMLNTFPNRRPFQLTRAGFAGIQKYSAVWTGDAPSTWALLSDTPEMMVGMSLSGVSFIGSDVGGFSGSNSPDHGAELYTRWFQLGTFSPFFRGHVQENTDWEEPWVFGEATTQIIRESLNLRYRLLPYWYQLMASHSIDATPVLRPLWFHDATNEIAHLRMFSDQFYLGDALMIAPVVDAGQTSKQVYVPEGLYYDFYSSKAIEGSQVIEVATPLSYMPVFVKSGSMILQQDHVQYSDTVPINERTLRLSIYPGELGQRTQMNWYQDDQISQEYQNGQFANTLFELETNEQGMSLSIAARTGDFNEGPNILKMNVHAIETLSAVYLDQNSIDFSCDAQNLICTFDYNIDGQAHEIKIEYSRNSIINESVNSIPRVPVHIEVNLPANTPEGALYLASDMYQWIPNATLLQRQGNTASIELSLLSTQTLNFKITRGQWSQVEVSEQCEEVLNRSISAIQGSLSITVAQWRDLCP